jgi:hypothetical protein
MILTRRIQLVAVGHGGGETVGRDQSRTVIVENVKSFDGIFFYTKYNAIRIMVYLVCIMTVWVMGKWPNYVPTYILPFLATSRTHFNIPTIQNNQFYYVLIFVFNSSISSWIDTLL